MKKVGFIISVYSLYFMACTNSVKENRGNRTDTVQKEYYKDDSVIRSIKKYDNEIGIEKEIIFNGLNDTSDVIIKSSNIQFRIHYYNNKPQGVLVHPIGKGDNLLPHYIRENKGVLIKLSSDTITFIRGQYINEGGGGLSFDSLGNVTEFATWEQLDNVGKIYKLKDRMIQVDVVKKGEVADSLFFIKR